MFWQARPHTRHDLLGRKLEVEGAPISIAVIDGDLLERLNQLSRTFKVRDELVCSVATIVGELGEPGTAYRTGKDLVGEVRAAARERRGHCKADADRAVEFMRDPGDEPAECSQPLGCNEIALCFAGVQSGFGQF